MTTGVAITLNWKGKGVNKPFEALNVCSIVKGKNNSLTSLLLFESLHLYERGISYDFDPKKINVLEIGK
jgi:hypothetical protein